jgi:hypothetical protein
MSSEPLLCFSGCSAVLSRGLITVGGIVMPWLCGISARLVVAGTAYSIASSVLLRALVLIQEDPPQNALT